MIPIISMNRLINEQFSVNSAVTLNESGISDLNFGFIKVFSKPKIRADFDGNLNENELNTELLFSTDMNKKFSILGVK